jgi:hypothetical protein
MQFGNLVLIEKTFTRENTNPRGQDYDGIKFRRGISKKEGKEGDIEETFTISDKLFNSLQLSTYALSQANIPENGGVLLMVVEDQDKVKPIAKIMRQQKQRADGTTPVKGRIFSNEFVSQGLIDAGILDPKKIGNQFFALENLTEKFEDRPEHVKGIFQVVIDETVDTSGEDEGQEGSEAEQEQAATEQQPAQSNF